MKKKNISAYLPLFRFSIPVISFLFGYFIWLEGHITSTHNTLVWRYATTEFYILFIIITNCYIFYRFASKSLSGKILIFITGFSLSVVLIEVLVYTNFGYACLADVRPMIFYQTLTVISFLSIPAAAVFGIFIFLHRFSIDSELLTNSRRTDNENSNKFERLIEIVASFPVYIGIYHIAFLIFCENFHVLCYQVPPFYAEIISYPWIILMGGFIFNNIKKILMK